MYKFAKIIVLRFKIINRGSFNKWMREFEACTNSSREDQNDRVSMSDFNQSFNFF